LRRASYEWLARRNKVIDRRERTGKNMRGVIRVGDSTSHGGKVVTGRDQSVVMGRPVACVGDSCTCPKSGHHDCVIVEGDPNVLIDGKAVAFDGHKTSCGASLISSLSSSGKQ
jgi:uncharacterized Zn-binding protein involved in type VI secretion